ncbi:hypothetical protein MKY20_11525 [Cytobacillus sp. FSL W8-0315]|uniref:phage adaptor protein n=1 Tax=Cytobacillus sp. FSL W8-0315 TaxID=2921600 RepID=UPI0030F7E4F1
MNLTEIIEEVNKDIDDSLDNGEISGWVNRALDDLTPIAKAEAKYNSDSAPFQLPNDFFDIAHLFVGDEEYFPVELNDRVSRGYRLWGKEVTLQKNTGSGEIELYYYKRLTHLENGDDVPEIDPAFHDLLILYTIAYSQFADEEPERQMDAMNRYFQRKREFETFASKHSYQTFQIRLVE